MREPPMKMLGLVLGIFLWCLIANLFCKSNLKSEGAKNIVSSSLSFTIENLIAIRNNRVFLDLVLSIVVHYHLLPPTHLSKLKNFVSMRELNFAKLLPSMFIQSEKSPFSGRSGSSNNLTDSATIEISEAI